MNAAPNNPRAVRVELVERGYTVLIGPGLLGGLAGHAAAALGGPPRAAFVIGDRRVEAHTRTAVGPLAAAGCRVSRATVTATEPDKSLDTLAGLLERMGEARMERADPVIAVGGGITGDVAGFAAATYRRGVPIIQCPTTLLSMVDASVGGKTGVNLTVGGSLQKNMVGAFHQPALVLADTRTLETLPDREFHAGLAECVKHGLLDGCTGPYAGSHLGWIEASLDRILARDEDALLDLITRSVAFKAAVVVSDERELAPAGGRALLNLGHTFAHAIETLPHLSPTGREGDAPLLHGEAVALGLVACAATSAALGLADGALVKRLRVTLARCGLPTAVAGLPDLSSLLRLMGADKKTSGGTLRLVLPEPGERASVVAGVDRPAIDAGWGAIRA